MEERCYLLKSLRRILKKGLKRALINMVSHFYYINGIFLKKDRI